jgi:hypothetical protein
MKRILLLIFLFVLFINPGFAQKKIKPLKDEDKVEIVKTILLETDFLCGYLHYGEKKWDVFLSTENIISTQIPKITGINLILISKEELEIKRKTDFCFYSFSDFKIKGSKVLVSFGRTWFSTSKWGIRGESSNYEFKKVKGKWKGELVDTSISLS